jgi:hypothetical protein
MDQALALSNEVSKMIRAILETTKPKPRLLTTFHSELLFADFVWQAEAADLHEGLVPRRPDMKTLYAV